MATKDSKLNRNSRYDFGNDLLTIALKLVFRFAFLQVALFGYEFRNLYQWRHKMYARFASKNFQHIQILAMTTPEWLEHLRRHDPDVQIMCNFGEQIIIVPAKDLEPIYGTDYVPDSLPLG